MDTYKEVKIIALIEQLRNLELELQNLTGEPLASIKGLDGIPLLLSEAEAELRLEELSQRKAANMQGAILNTLTAHIALLNSDGVILAVNESWKRFAKNNALQGSNFLVGENYLSVYDRITDDSEGSEHSLAAAEGIRRVLAGEQDDFSMEYPCHSPTEKRWYRMVVTPFSDHEISGAVVSHIDLTKRTIARENLRNSQNHLQSSLQSRTNLLNECQLVANVGSWETNLDTRELIWTEQTHRIFETSPEHYTPTHQGFLECIHPEDRDAVDKAFLRSLEQPGSFENDYRILMPDGRIKYVEERWRTYFDELNKATRASGTCQDITARKLTENALAEKTLALRLLSSCNEALIRSDTELSLLAAICQAAVEIGNFRLAWVGYAMDDKTKSVKPRAYFGSEIGYLKNISVSWDETSPFGKGPAGRTIRSGELLIIPDIEQEPSFTLWLAEAKSRGFRGVITLPLKDASRTFGVMLLYMPEVRHPQPDELHVLQELADNLAFGINNIREREKKQRMQNALVTVAAAVTATTGQKFFEQLTRNMAEALGANASFAAKLLPGVPLRARTIAALVDGEHIDNYEYLIKGTPCEKLMHSESHMISKDAANEYIESQALHEIRAQSYVGCRLESSDGRFIGILFALFNTPLVETDLATTILQIFGARAAFELERQEKNTRLRDQAALLDKARDGIFVHDLNHKIIYWNQGAERIFGWAAFQAIGADVRELIGQADPTFNSPLDQISRSVDLVKEYEYTTKEGKVLNIERHSSIVYDENGQLHSVFSINTDVTERKKIEVQYFRAQRMESIGTLAGGIAHDLNNMLTPIVMSIDLLKVKLEDSQSLDILSIIDDSAKRAADLVRQVLTFARGVESRQLKVQIGHLIQELQKVINDTFPKNIQIQINIAPDLWLVQGDSTQLHQVLLNLCVNARDAMPDGGNLTLSASNLMLDEQYAGMNIEASPGPYVSIEVEDSGSGMPPSVIEHIFEPFYTTKELGKGTGLGLSTSIAIIKSHGGFVRVYSEVATGSRFHIYIPAMVDIEAEEDQPITNELPRGNGELILVVDDEPAVREITRQTLEAFGYSVALASDGVDATSIYAERKEEIALVLTDMMMPIMDGPTMIQVLLKLDPQVRIIAASGLNANSMVAKATHAGVSHFIPKPYTAETLLKTIRDVLEL